MSWKTTKIVWLMEDNLNFLAYGRLNFLANGRQPQQILEIEDDLNFVANWKTTSTLRKLETEDNLKFLVKGRQLQLFGKWTTTSSSPSFA